MVLRADVITGYRVGRCRVAVVRITFDEGVIYRCCRRSNMLVAGVAPRLAAKKRSFVASLGKQVTKNLPDIFRYVALSLAARLCKDLEESVELVRHRESNPFGRYLPWTTSKPSFRFAMAS